MKRSENLSTFRTYYFSKFYEISFRLSQKLRLRVPSPLQYVSSLLKYLKKIKVVILK